ncbi:tetratricopeptide repeat protein [Candidatus Campbellbacteria bacterium]|nr:MAG: tetratricopeptide repeat protein [Candidatus Campbellbacteria bacterium]
MDNKLIKSPYYSLEKLSEDSRLVKRGLRDLSVWPKIESLFNELKRKYEIKDIDGCIQLAREILATDPCHFFTRCYYGRCLYEKDDYEKSAEMLGQCIEEERGYFFLWKFRADAYMKMKRYEQALSDLKESLVIDPGNGATLDDIAQCLYFMGKFNEAYEFIDKAIEIERDSEMPMVRKGQFFEYQGRIKEAVEQYSMAAHEFPTAEFARKKVIELSKTL